MSIGKYIKERRIELKFSQREFARLANISHGFISKMERDLVRPPNIEFVLRKMAQLLDLEEDLFILMCGKIPGWLKQTLIEYPELMLAIKEKDLPLKGKPMAKEFLH